MAVYPTRQEIREMLGFDLEAEIEKLSSWQRQDVTLCEIKSEVYGNSPAMLHAWAYLAEAIFDVCPSAKIESGSKIVRPQTREELEESALSAVASRIYSERQAAEKEAANGDAD